MFSLAPDIEVGILRASKDTPMDSVCVLVPAYNEERTIQEVVLGLRHFCSNVIVIDDCSTDATAVLARSAGARLVRHPINFGQGAALQTDISFALEQGASHIVTFDADLQHRPDEIPRLLATLDRSGSVFALGSRFLGTATNLDRSRKLMLKLAVRFTTGLKITDTHNGLRAMTRRGASRLQIRQNRMAHASENTSADRQDQVTLCRGASDRPLHQLFQGQGPEAE